MSVQPCQVSVWACCFALSWSSASEATSLFLPCLAILVGLSLRTVSAPDHWVSLLYQVGGCWRHYSDSFLSWSVCFVMFFRVCGEFITATPSQFGWPFIFWAFAAAGAMGNRDAIMNLDGRLLDANNQSIYKQGLDTWICDFSPPNTPQCY